MIFTEPLRRKCLARPPPLCAAGARRLPEEGARKVMPDVLQALLEKHQAWFLKKNGGARLNLSLADLQGCDFDKSQMSSAKLSGANLSRAILTGAILCEADLFAANLDRSDLTGADLTRADLRGAYLRDAKRSEERRVGKECRSRWSPYH